MGLLGYFIYSVCFIGIVAVDPNGTYDFTTINAAIQAAPNNSVAADGYFLIFVTAGVYNESVMVPKHKKYVLMIGEGNNQTIITGRKNVPDGSTTFNSGTVSELLFTVNYLLRIVIRSTLHWYEASSKVTRAYVQSGQYRTTVIPNLV